MFHIFLFLQRMSIEITRQAEIRDLVTVCVISVCSFWFQTEFKSDKKWRSTAAGAELRELSITLAIPIGLGVHFCRVAALSALHHVSANFHQRIGIIETIKVDLTDETLFYRWQKNHQTRHKEIDLHQNSSPFTLWTAYSSTHSWSPTLSDCTMSHGHVSGCPQTMQCPLISLSEHPSQVQCQLIQRLQRPNKLPISLSSRWIHPHTTRCSLTQPSENLHKLRQTRASLHGNPHSVWCPFLFLFQKSNRPHPTVKKCTNKSISIAVERLSSSSNFFLNW